MNFVYLSSGKINIWQNVTVIDAAWKTVKRKLKNTNKQTKQKNKQSWTGCEPVTSAISVKCFTNWAFSRWLFFDLVMRIWINQPGESMKIKHLKWSAQSWLDSSVDSVIHPSRFTNYALRINIDHLQPLAWTAQLVKPTAPISQRWWFRILL